QIPFVIFDPQFGSPSLAVAFFVEMGGPVPPHVGDNIANICSPPTRFNFHDNPLEGLPSAGFVAKRVVALDGPVRSPVGLLGAADGPLGPPVKAGGFRPARSKNGPSTGPGPTPSAEVNKNDCLPGPR